MNVTQKLISSHLVSGTMQPDEEIGITIDHVLQQDATGTLVMLELEALNLGKTKAEKAVQYVDHNLLQADYKNADDHAFLQSAAKKFGYWYSRAGNGISHVVHMERFGVPGRTLLGSDSHTCAGGSLGMLAIGTGGLDVALASAGEPYYVKMPKVMGIELRGDLPPWVSAKDIVLEMLRRYDVKGGRGFILEYYGDGLQNLSAWDRHVIANMGTELGATSTVFPSDIRTKEFMVKEERGHEWVKLQADEGATYDAYEKIDLSKLVPLIAKPSSPGNVVEVSEVAGEPISQVVIGSSANPSHRDFWIAAEMVSAQTISPDVSFDINPSSREVIQNLTASGSIQSLMQAGARFHQSGCMGCIGMGQAPASHTVSLRTMPRNFPGRSGTEDDKVYLCSPETATASALTGRITDPRELESEFDMEYPSYCPPKKHSINTMMLIKPSKNEHDVDLRKGPNVKSIPDFEALEDIFEVPVLLKMGDNISTDEILKAGAEVLPLRSNIPKISEYAFYAIDKSFVERAKDAMEEKGGHIVVAGDNYAQGSSREHAALTPRFFQQKAVIAKSYARIGWQNLINFGIVPFEFQNPDDYDKIEQGDEIKIENLRKKIADQEDVTAQNTSQNVKIPLTYKISTRQRDILLAGGAINYVKEKLHN